MYLLFSTLLWIVIGCICSNTAKQRGRNPISWFFLGIALGVIGLIILYILPPKLEMAAAAPTPSPNNDLPLEVSISPSQASPPKEITILWYYLDNEDKQYGPMSFNALQQAWDEDQITSSTYVWNEEMENWKTLEELPDCLSKIRRSPDE